MNISKENNIVEFVEQYLGTKLQECQKELIKHIYNNKNWNTQSFSPAHSYSYSCQSVMNQILKEFIKEYKGDVK